MPWQPEVGVTATPRGRPSAGLVATAWACASIEYGEAATRATDAIEATSCARARGPD